MKRIWQTAESVPLDGGHGVQLDGKPLKKPGGALLAVPFPALAAAIAAEWRGAGLDGGDITPDDLPLTRLATTATDRIAAARPQIIAQIAAYGLHDLLCYHAESPPELAARQTQNWSPWLDWTAENFGVRLQTGTGLNPIPQPDNAQPTFTATLAARTDFELAGLGVAVPALGSLILGLALLQNALTPAAAHTLALLDELFQAERWGDDEDAATRRAAIQTDLTLCQTFWNLCR
jgi:chaperone required for assembly of F1-ATPase